MDQQQFLDALRQVLSQQLQKVETNFLYVDFTTMKQFDVPFNQVTFVNYDPINPLYVNQHEIPPNSEFSISLNTREVNRTTFNIDPRNSPTAKAEIIYTEYIGIDK